MDHLNILLEPTREAHSDLAPSFLRASEIAYLRIYESSVPDLVSVFIVGPGVGMRLTREQVQVVRDGLDSWLVNTAPRARFAVDTAGVAVEVSDPSESASIVPLDDDAWLYELDHIPLLCQRCGANLRDDGSVDVLLDCGACDATVCATCKRIWASMGPCIPEHHTCGLLGHLTLAEQPKFSVAVKRR